MLSKDAFSEDIEDLFDDADLLNGDEKKAKRAIEKKATELLRSPDFFFRFLQDVRRDGLIGERRNALALYLAGTSRLRPRPVNVMVKGESSSGKNYLVRKVVNFFPKKRVHEISSMSAHALNFIPEDDLTRSILYFYEIEGARSAHPNRLLISEGKLIHWYSASSKCGRETREKVTAGPVACISTTTENALKIDDESRHLSLWVNESPAQTKRIAGAYVNSYVGALTAEERGTWIAVQNLLEERRAIPIEAPSWCEKLVELIPVGDVRIRRYWPAFIEAWKTVALMRSYRYDKADLEKRGNLTATFGDFAVANLILDKVLAESLSRSATDEEIWTAQLVARIAKGTAKGVGASDLLGEPGVTSLDKAYRMLRKAERARTIYRANWSQKDNTKLYLPVGESGFLGTPNLVLSKLGLRIHGEFVDPFTGKTVPYGKNGT
jgi:hypothetical protein